MRLAEPHTQQRLRQTQVKHQPMTHHSLYGLHIFSTADHFYDVTPLLTAVQDLGRRHVGYDLSEESYNKVGESLRWTHIKGFGEDITKDVNAAWVETYTTINKVLIEAGREMAAPFAAYNDMLERRTCKIDTLDLWFAQAATPSIMISGVRTRASPQVTVFSCCTGGDLREKVSRSGRTVPIRNRM